MDAAALAQASSRIKTDWLVDRRQVDGYIDVSMDEWVDGYNTLFEQKEPTR